MEDVTTDLDTAKELVEAWVAQGPGTPAGVRWTERVTAQTLWELCGAACGAGVEMCALALEDAAAQGLVLRLGAGDGHCAYVRNPCAAADGCAGLAHAEPSEGLSEAELYAALAVDEDDAEGFNAEEDGGDGDAQKWDSAAAAVLRALGVKVPATAPKENEDSEGKSGGIAVGTGGDAEEDFDAAECSVPWKRMRDVPVETAPPATAAPETTITATTAPEATTTTKEKRSKHKHSDNSHPGYKIKGKVMIALDPETLSRERAEMNRRNSLQARARKASRSAVSYTPR